MPDLETPDEDAAEQQQDVSDAETVQPDTPAPSGSTTEAPLEADEGDLVESSREVPLDEDDWR